MDTSEQEVQRFMWHVAEMMSLADAAVSRAIGTLAATCSDETVARIRDHQQQLARLHASVNDEARQLLTRLHAAGADLRRVLSATRICSQLERVGDHALHMVEAAQRQVTEGVSPAQSRIAQIAETVREMASETVRSFKQANRRAARGVIASNRRVEAYMKQVLADVLTDDVLRRGIVDHVDISAELARLTVARSLESIGGRCADIAKEVVRMSECLERRDQAHKRRSLTRRASQMLAV